MLVTPRLTTGTVPITPRSIYELHKQGLASLQEDDMLQLAHKEHGNKWIEIAKMVGGR